MEEAGTATWDACYDSENSHAPPLDFACPPGSRAPTIGLSILPGMKDGCSHIYQNCQTPTKLPIWPYRSKRGWVDSTLPTVLLDLKHCSYSWRQPEPPDGIKIMGKSGRFIQTTEPLFHLSSVAIRDGRNYDRAR